MKMSSKRYPTGGNSLYLTRDATLKVIDREIPGMAEAMGHQSMLIIHHAMITCTVAGIRGHSLIINLSKPHGCKRKSCCNSTGTETRY